MALCVKAVCVTLHSTPATTPLGTFSLLEGAPCSELHIAGAFNPCGSVPDAKGSLVCLDKMQRGVKNKLIANELGIRKGSVRGRRNKKLIVTTL